MGFFFSFSVRDVPSTFLNSEKFFIFLWKYFFSTTMLLWCQLQQPHSVFQYNRRGLERKHFEQITKMRHNNLVSAFYLPGAILKEREIDKEIKGLLCFLRELNYCPDTIAKYDCEGCTLKAWTQMFFMFP